MREIRGENAGNYFPFISGSGDVIYGDDPPHHPPQIRSGWCIYTTHVAKIRGCHMHIGRLFKITSRLELRVIIIPL
jgi:hypothetical protein